MKIIDNISRWMGYIGIFVVLLLMLLVVADVFMRVFFNSPIKGTVELVSMTMVGLALGMGVCALRGRHVIAEIISRRFPPRVQSIVDSLVILACLAIYTLISWQAILETIDEWRNHYTVSLVLPIPMYIFWGIYSLSFILLCLTIIGLLANKLREAVKG